MDKKPAPNRKQRRADKAADKTIDEMNDRKFLEIADKFIDLANKENQKTNASDLHMIFLYAAARYNAHVGKNVVEIEEHEPFVQEMAKSYQEMLRNHLADPSV